MAILDAVAKSVAKSLIGAFGKTMTLKMETSTPDPTTGTNTLVEPFGSPFTVQGVVESFSPSATDFDGVAIKPGDLRVAIAASQVTTEPAAGNTLYLPYEDTTRLDDVRTVKAVQKQYGGDDVYGYVLLARR